MNAAQARALEVVRALTAARASGDAVGDVSTLTRAMLEAVERAGDQALLPLWAAGRLAEDDPLVGRALSFMIARYAVDLGGDRWLPMLWLLAPPHSRDCSTLQNCLTALQRHPGLSGVTLRVLCREIGPFLIHVLQQSDELLEAVTDVLYAYLDAGMLPHVLTTRAAHTLQQRLKSLPPATPGPVADAGKALASELGASFPDEFPGVVEDLRSFLDSRTLAAPSDEWSQVLHWTEEGVREFVERYAAFEDLTAVATARNVPAHDLHVTGRWASVGKLPIDFLEKILHTWRRLYTDVREKLAGDGEPPALFVLAPTRGSFVVRVLVETNEAALDTDATAAAEIVTFAESLPGLASQHDYTPLLRLAAEQSVDFEIDIAVPGPAAVRHRIRLTHIRARAAVATLSEAGPLSARTEIVVGVLDGASHRSGKFEMLPAVGTAPIVGTVARGGKSILLDKTIGDTYLFELSRVTDSASGAEKWELLRLTPSQVESAVANAMGEVLAPPPSVITSALLPQVDSLARIVEAVQVVASGGVLSPRTISLSQRHVDYHKSAARLLHLLSDEGTLLPAGATLVALSPARRIDHLGIQFEVSVIGQAWMNWASVARVADLDPGTAFDFLRERSSLTPSMIARRGRTLRRWARDLAGLSAGKAAVVDEAEDDE